MCCLKAAGLKPPKNFKVKFEGNDKLNGIVKEDGSINPKNGITLDQAIEWFKTVWSNYKSDFFTKYKQKNGHEWADEDLKAILVFLTGRREGAPNMSMSGYKKLAKIREQHTAKVDEPFQEEIIKSLVLVRL